MAKTELDSWYYWATHEWRVSVECYMTDAWLMRELRENNVTDNWQLQFARFYLIYKLAGVLYSMEIAW